MKQNQKRHTDSINKQRNIEVMNQAIRTIAKNSKDKTRRKQKIWLMGLKENEVIEILMNVTCGKKLNFKKTKLKFTLSEKLNVWSTRS